MIRELTQSDVAELTALHDLSGIDYKFPDLSSPLYLNRVVSVIGDKILAAGLHRICYETFVMVNPTARPQDKWEALKELDAELSRRAYWQGLDEVHAAVAPIRFDRRLRQLGWVPDRENWRLWSRQTNEKCG